MIWYGFSVYWSKKDLKNVLMFGDGIAIIAVVMNCKFHLSKQVYHHLPQLYLVI